MAIAAEPPWALIARRVIGRVEQMSHTPTGNQPGFDMATVVLNADAGNVYRNAVTMLHRNQSIRVLAENPATRTAEFGEGERTASISVRELGNRLSQILVASARQPGEPSATPRIVQGILRVCEDMRVTCSTQ